MKKKNLKGMTLVEIIIALAIFAMLGVVLVQVGVMVDQTTKSSTRLNKRVAIQSPYAASQNIEYTDDTGATAELAANGTSVEIYIVDDSGSGPANVEVTRGDGSKEEVNSDAYVYGTRYSTKAIVDGNDEVYRDDDVSNADHHLQFIVKADSVKVSFEDADALTVGETRQITYVDNDGSDQPLSGAVWTHKSEGADSVATIDSDGLITAVGKGSCTINGYSNGQRYKISIEVKETI